MLVTFLPAFLLSGFMFAIDIMPLPLRLITYFVPARYFLVVVRGIFLKGAGFDVLWPQIATLAAMGATILSLAASRFRKTTA